MRELFMKLNRKLRKSLILSVCMLILMVTAFIQIPFVRADNWWNTFTVRTDINLDLKVDMKDIGMDARAFGTYLGHPLWNADCDINSDGKVNMMDIGNIARNFGWVGETPPPSTLPSPTWTAATSS